MNKIILVDNTELFYENALYISDNNALEFSFSEEHDLGFVQSIFSENGELFDRDNISTLKLVDSEGNVMGVWEGFNQLLSITTVVNMKRANLGEKYSVTVVKIVLQKESVSDEFKRVTGGDIQELKDQNIALLETASALSASNMTLQGESAANMMAMAEMFEANIALQSENSSAMLAITELFESNIAIVDLNSKLQEENNASMMAITELYETVAALQLAVEALTPPEAVEGEEVTN